MRKFWVLFDARSGSSLLVSLLNCSSEVCCYPEVFANQSPGAKDETLEAFLQGRVLDARYAMQDGNPGASIEKHRAATAVGFKAKFYDMPPLTPSLERLQAADVSLIYLRRIDIVRQALSTITGLELHRRTGLFNALEARQAVGKCIVAPDHLLAWGMMYRATSIAMDHLYENYQSEKCLIDYEDLCDRQADVLARLQTFLDLAPFSAKAGLIKNTLPSLREAIENYDEVKAAIGWTPLGAFLRE